MKEFFSKLLFHIKRRMPAIIACILVFCTFGLYYLGVFEVSFIKRPESWANNTNLLYDAIKTLRGEGADADVSDPTDTESSDTTAADDTSGTSGDKVANDGSNQVTVAPEDNGIGNNTVMPSVSQLASEGYTATDAPWSDTSKFALLETSYSLPKKFSFSEKTYEKAVAVHYDDGTEAEVKTETVTEDRPAIELYMGYIIFDDVGTLYLLDSNGTALSKYTGKYIPAYTRDREGRPLFYQTYKETVEYPTSVGEPDEEGNTPWLTTATVEVERKRYYYLGEDGRTFVESDYNDATDNRGLYFDYPSYYGIADEDDTKDGLVRYYKETTKVLTKTDKNKTITDVFAEVKWLFKKLDDAEFDPDGEETVYPYTKAYDYSEKYAVVSGDVTWTYTDEDVDKDGDGIDDTVEVTATELYVVDESGKKMFDSRKGFRSDLGWSANEYYTDPLLRDISSIGSYYFDHGLLRIRLVSYDRYQFTEFDMKMIGTDDDILIRPDGSRFYIPSGYTLEAYSDGMLLLSRDGKYGYMDYTGKWVMEMGLLDAAPFLEGVAAMKNSKGKYGMIDTDGNTVIPFRYDYISSASSGIVAAYSEEDGWEIYTKMAK